MNQEQLLAQRDELAREYHPGEFEMQRTFETFKEWTISVVGCLVAVILPTFLFVIAIGYFAGDFPYIEMFQVFGIALLCTLGLPYIIYIGLYYSAYNTDVYIYTNGLVYLNRHRSGVARWEEIDRVDLREYSES